jgi:hypothetical protein
VILSHPFHGRHAAIATLHGKEQVIGPILNKWYGIGLNVAEGVNTDALGTFTGEIPRFGNMLDAAREKARLAIQKTGRSIGLGSEGSFGPHPFAYFFSSGLEALILIDAENDNEIIVQKRFKTNYESILIQPGHDTSPFLRRVGFPHHALIVRPEQSITTKGIVKGIVSNELLGRAIRNASIISKTGSVIIQTDMRAHMNPTRMKCISILTKTLALRAARLCPICSTPGFGFINALRGLPCESCARPTRLIRAELHGCLKCGHQRIRHERSSTTRAEALWCDACNP